jgi:hypothetical protein
MDPISRRTKRLDALFRAVEKSKGSALEGGKRLRLVVFEQVFLTRLPHASDHDQQEPTSGFDGGIIRNIVLKELPWCRDWCHCAWRCR